MFNSLCSKKGISLIEVLVSLVLLTVGILGLLTLLPSSWRLSGRSDHLGRASGILTNQLHFWEAQILNPNATAMVTEGAKPPQTVYPGGQFNGGVPVQKQGDLQFTVNTNLTNPGGGDAWLVRVNVTWPGNTTGITESMRVVRQQNFSQ